MDTIEALNPKPGTGVTRVNKERYDATRRALLAVIPRSKSGVPFGDLPDLVMEQLPNQTLPGGGSIMWHVTTIKLDLEARGLIERVEGAKPQRVRRTTS